MAQQQGYTVGVVRRMVTAFRYAEGLAERGLIQDVSVVAGVPYSLVEMMKRLDDVDRAKADKLLPLMMNGVIRLEELRGAYNEAAERAEVLDSTKAGRRAAVRFSERCRSAVQLKMELLTGDAACRLVVESVGSVGLVQPDMTLVKLADDDITFIDAVQAQHLPQRSPPAVLRSVLHEAVVGSLYFRRYWILLPSTSADEGVLVDQLDAFGRAAIGVAVVTTDGTCDIRVAREARAEAGDLDEPRFALVPEKKAELRSNMRSWLLG